MSELQKPRNMRQIASEIAIVTLMADHLTEKKDQLRDEFRIACAELGADASKAIIEGKEIAKVSMVTPKPTPYITDENAFLRYVKTFHPDEIIEAVRESFRKKFLTDWTEDHDGWSINEETGEMVEFIGFAQKSAYVSTRFATDGRTYLADKFDLSNFAIESYDEI